MSYISERSQRIEKAIMGLPQISDNVDVQAQISGDGTQLYLHFVSEDDRNDGDAVRSVRKFSDWLDETKIKHFIQSPRAVDVHGLAQLESALTLPVRALCAKPQDLSSFKCNVLDHTTDERYMTVVRTPGEALAFVMEASRLTWDQPSTVDSASIMTVHTTSLPHGGWSITIVASFEGTTQVYTAILTP